MPRNLHPGASSFRNRIRITNKTRLKIHHGNPDADPLFIPDEDEEKHHLSNLVAGVDAEDANEHHLQAVLSASQRTQSHGRSTRAGDKPQSLQSAAYIPTPDSTGVVHNYAEFYPPDKWKDPTTYLCSSSTVDELCLDGLSGGFTYYMDERDGDWLDKNNEEARGEGTSAQGAMSSATRTSARSAKARGKEPESPQPLVISENEFELVMGLFEKVTHEKTEYLHHGLETGMAFPAFSEYRETFSSPLSTPIFSSFIVPSWIPPSAQLVHIARTIYPYWKARRIERGGRRIIPTLNFDEGDTLNESYVCFRRREIKSVRKTRASQANSSDKLLRLQHELSYPLDLAKAILSRENQKKENIQHARQIWEKRMALADLKRKYPTLNDKADEELLIEKEKPRKLDIARPTKLRTEFGSSNHSEITLRPRERTALINEAIEATLNRQKEQDHHWEDQTDNPYQPQVISYPNRLFKYVPVSFTPAELDGKPVLQRQSCALRLRRGRGGRILIDRRDAQRPSIRPFKRLKIHSENIDVDMDNDSDDERSRKLTERWRFDADDDPAFGPEGYEQNRLLVDDYAEKYLRHSMTLLTDVDQQNLMNDPSIPVMVDGRQQNFVPFRLGMPLQPMRRDGVRPMHPPQAVQPLTTFSTSNQLGGASANMQQLKKISPTMVVPSPVQMRISSNGGMRLPSVIATNSAAIQPTPPNSVAIPSRLPATNGNNRTAINISHVDIPKLESMAGHAPTNGAVHVHASDMPASRDVKLNGVNGSPPKHTPHAALSVNGTQPTAAALAQFALHGVPNLKSVLANNCQDLSALQRVCFHLPGNPNFSLQQLPAGVDSKLPATRPIQWVAGTTKSGVVPSINGVSNGMDSPPPSSTGSLVPVRVPSANGTRVPSNGQMTRMMSPPTTHTPSPKPSSTNMSLSQAQSPPRIPVTPSITKVSPSLQQQQLGSSKSGY